MSILVIGAGAGGLAAAIDLAAKGCDVTVLERAGYPGGKIRAVDVGGSAIDGGPTVFTMRWVFDGLMEAAGTRLEDQLTLSPATVLARHGWTSGGRLDLFADRERSAEAIGVLAGPREAEGYRAFCRAAADIHDTLRDSFMAAEKPSRLGLVGRVGIGRVDALLRTRPWSTLWSALGDYFRDPRLRQLFGRYSTYVGSSPVLAPATLMLIAHVEHEGVWIIDGGMRALPEALRGIGERLGARYRFGVGVSEILVESGRVAGAQLENGERLAADAVVYNGDAAALSSGLLGEGARRAVPPVSVAERSLSAVTWCVRARVAGFPLSHHNVFFADDYPREFEAIFGRRAVTEEPTVYICAQDRAAGAEPARDPGPDGPERLLMLVNAPADGDRGFPDHGYLEEIERRMRAVLAACGLKLEIQEAVTTAPDGFARLFPGTGGALYGIANHGSAASFKRPGAVGRVGGLYLAGGSVHPGAGVPMATLSGRIAAARLLNDLGRA